MPLYEYDCPVCGRFETLQKVDDKPLKECPSCKDKGRKEKVTRALSLSAFHLKGSGWYKTDYGSNGSAISPKKTQNAEKEKSSEAKSSKEGDTGTGSTKASSSGGCGSGGCGCKDN